MLQTTVTPLNLNGQVRNDSVKAEILQSLGLLPGDLVAKNLHYSTKNSGGDQTLHTVIGQHPDVEVKQITGVASTDVVTCVAHGLKQGDRVWLRNVKGGLQTSPSTKFAWASPYGEVLTVATVPSVNTLTFTGRNFVTDITAGELIPLHGRVVVSTGRDFGDLWLGGAGLRSLEVEMASGSATLTAMGAGQVSTGENAFSVACDWQCPNLTHARLNLREWAYDPAPPVWAGFEKCELLGIRLGGPGNATMAYLDFRSMTSLQELVLTESGFTSDTNLVELKNLPENCHLVLDNMAEGTGSTDGVIYLGQTGGDLSLLGPNAIRLTINEGIGYGIAVLSPIRVTHFNMTWTGLRGHEFLDFGHLTPADLREINIIGSSTYAEITFSQLHLCANLEKLNVSVIENGNIALSSLLTTWPALPKLKHIQLENADGEPFNIQGSQNNHAFLARLLDAVILGGATDGYIYINSTIGTLGPQVAILESRGWDVVISL